MSGRQLHRFRISYRLDGYIQLKLVEGINLRHAKDKILFSCPDATDLTDWTFEKDEDLKRFLQKQNITPLLCAKIMEEAGCPEGQHSLPASH